MRLEDSVSLVTGGAVRVGRSIALRLASLGSHVVLHYRSSREEAEATAEEIRALGRDVLLVQADLAVKSEAIAAAEKAWAWKDGVDVLVNSAANFAKTELEEIEEADWDFSLDTNLLGPFWLAQSLGPRMKSRGHGKIVNIADISWQSPWTSRIPYCVSKAGLVSLSMGLAKAFAPAVQVNVIGPGPVLFPEDSTPEERETAIARTLLKRPGSPEDIADAVEFLCRCDYVTGVFLPVDGGQSVRRG